MTVSSIAITDGDWALNAPVSGDCNSGGVFGLYRCAAAGSANPINTIDGLFEGPTLTSFDLLGTPVTTWTAPSAFGTQPSTSGNPIQGAVDIVLGTISLDMGSFYMNWSGTNILQAPRSFVDLLDPMATGSYDLATGAFGIAWSSAHIGGPSDGYTSYWHLTGIAATVPDPENYALMCTGLGLVGMAARRRQLAHTMTRRR